MFWSQYRYNGQPISHTNTLEWWRVGIEHIARTNVDSRSQETPIAWYHGSRKTPTYLTGRKITIEGGILCDTREQSVLWMHYLRNLFAIEPITGQWTVTRVYKVIDEQWDERRCDVSIKEPLQFDERDDDILDGDTRKRRVVLFSQDARMFGEIIDETGDEWHIGWWVMPRAMNNNRDMMATYNAIECINGWSESSPMTVTITAINPINTPLTIVNMTTRKALVINVSAVSGDIIVVNSYDRIITKNGNDITYLKQLGSVRPSAKPWSNDIVCFDDDSGLLWSDFDVAIEFYTIMI